MVGSSTSCRFWLKPVSRNSKLWPKTPPPPSFAICSKDQPESPIHHHGHRYCWTKNFPFLKINICSITIAMIVCTVILMCVRRDLILRNHRQWIFQIWADIRQHNWDSNIKLRNCTFLPRNAGTRTSVWWMGGCSQSTEKQIWKYVCKVEIVFLQICTSGAFPIDLMALAMMGLEVVSMITNTRNDDSRWWWRIRIVTEGGLGGNQDLRISFMRFRCSGRLEGLTRSIFAQFPSLSILLISTTTININNSCLRLHRRCLHQHIWPFMCYFSSVHEISYNVDNY